MSSVLHSFRNLNEVVSHIRSLDKKFVLLYAYNGIGKTRLSMTFKESEKVNKGADTLYFNAFTEDLFSWDNDYKYKKKRKDGSYEPEELWAVNFIREEIVKGSSQNIEYIKISRGEENIFIWCFFLAVVQLVIDKQEAYHWVKYVYIDDPISSLDDNNAISVASHLVQMIKPKENDVKIIVSSHHTLFFNVMWNELSQERKKFQPYFFAKGEDVGTYTLRYTKDTPFFHHIALLKELKRVADIGTLYTYHFSKEYP